jgi:hypothetical protein
MPENRPPLALWKKIILVVAGIIIIGLSLGYVLHVLFPRSKPSTIAEEMDLHIRGNRKSKVYHSPDCPQYNNIKEENIIYFKTREEAQAAGYHAAKNCP